MGPSGPSQNITALLLMHTSISEQSPMLRVWYKRTTFSDQNAFTKKVQIIITLFFIHLFSINQWPPEES
jgi:hypothetical protein